MKRFTPVFLRAGGAGRGRSPERIRFSGGWSPDSRQEQGNSAPAESRRFLHGEAGYGERIRMNGERET